MNRMAHSLDYPELMNIVNRAYRLRCEAVCLHREVVGTVYYVTCADKRYVFKLYRSSNTEDAFYSVNVMHYLKLNDYPVATLCPDVNGDLSIKINTPDGECAGVLFEFIEGTEPDLTTKYPEKGQQIGRLHHLLETYPQTIRHRGKAFYIDRFISILEKLQYNPSKIHKLEAYGAFLWHRMEQLPAGCCHGDLHTGNMILDDQNQYVLFDFDAVSNAYAIIDVATVVDQTDFFHLNEDDYERTQESLDAFYAGYSKEKMMSALEIQTVFDFIAIRHYELIATLSLIRGIDCLSHAYLDAQFEWLMQWKATCERHRSNTYNIV